jgi:hypothetical protein
MGSKGVRELIGFGTKLDDTNPKEGDPISKEMGSPFGFFDTLQSRHGDGRATVERHVQAHERRFRVCAWDRDLGGEDLAGGTPGEDRVADHRITPAREDGSAGCMNP